MARPRNIIPRIVGFDMVELASKILKMSDAELVAWLRKAVSDCIEGCTDPNCDPFIRIQFERSLAQMRSKQEIDAQTYKNRLARQGKNLAESATMHASGATALADGDIREDSLNVPSDSNVATLESPTSAKNLNDQETTNGPRQAEARESRSTGGTPKRVEKPAASHAETLPVLSLADTGADAKKPYGTCKHVMLTDAEGHHLREVYGKNLTTAIDILDAYIENGGKAAKKYKNHAAVLRKGNWVWNKVQETILNEKRIENASNRPKNWKAEERERNARVLRGESADGKNYLRDDELTPEELEAKYG